MRSKVVRTLGFVFLLCGAGVVLAQQQAPQQGQPQQPGKPREPGDQRLRWQRKSEEKQSAPEKSKLEEMLTEALKNNPDIRVATAKLAEAEAKLNRARVEVTQKVVSLYQAIQSQQTAVKLAQEKYEWANKMHSSGNVPQNVIGQVSSELAAAKAKLEELQVQLPALLGKVQKSASAGTAEPQRVGVWLWDVEDGRSDLRLAEAMEPLVFRYPKSGAEWKFERAKVNVPQAEKLRKALQTPIKVDFKDMTFDDILQNLSKKVEGLSFRNLFERRSDRFPENKYSLRFEETLPVSAILQALSDETGCLFFVRDYGIVALSDKHAPKGAMTVETFLQQKPAEGPQPQSNSRKNPPAKDVEGLVKSTDASGLLTISIGSDAGLAKGHTLELFRLNPSSPTQSKYLGTVLILEAEAHQSVAQPIARLSSPPQSGDRVASRILDK